jgi:hypothetical protein
VKEQQAQKSSGDIENELSEEDLKGIKSLEDKKQRMK